MKHLKNTFGILFMTTILFTSCERIEGIDNDCDGDCIAPATAEEFSNLKTEALEALTQNFKFNVEDGSTTFTSLAGVDITINGNCLKLNDEAVTGEVDIEYIELFDKGNMLITNKPTMGVNDAGDKALLISGGEFLINATQNGEVLKTTCSIRILVPSNLTGDVDSDMLLWEGNIDADDNLAWEVAEGRGDQGGVFTEGEQYFAFLQQFGWSNIDRFYSDPRDKTTILVEAPFGYDYTNSAIYLSYDGEDTGLAALDTFEDGLFSEHYGQIPIGLECHIIFVTEDDDNWKYAIKEVTIVEDETIIFTEDETTTATEAELITVINGLP